MRLQADRLRDLGSRVLADGMNGLDAATGLLLRARPSGAGPSGAGPSGAGPSGAGPSGAGPSGAGGADVPAGTSPSGISRKTLELRGAGESATGAAVRLAAALSDSYLPIQGPPGTGKTYTGAEQILALVAQGRTVGITGPSHAVICNFINEVVKHAAASGLAVPVVGQRADRDNPYLHPDAQSLDYPKLVAGLADRDLDVAAGTTWMWARPDLRASVDTLFVDEAGQMSLADVLAVAGAARNLVLLGDPQQLAQPSQAAHPPGSGASALEHILDGRATMPPDAGLLLDKTYRMHPTLCRFTSETFYDGKLTGVEGLELQEILGGEHGILCGAGLRVVEVPHEGNGSSSPEEAAVVTELVRSLLDFAGRSRGSARFAACGRRPGAPSCAASPCSTRRGRRRHGKDQTRRGR
jgi:AAA domain